MRLITFIIALLLLAGTVDPTEGWLVALTVVAGIAVFRPRFDDGFSLRPAIDIRLAAFVFATLLLAGVMEPTKDWLIGLTIVTGVAMVMPRIVHVDLFGPEPQPKWCDWTWEVRGSDRWRPSTDWTGWRKDFDNEMGRASRSWEEDTSWS